MAISAQQGSARRTCEVCGATIEVMAFKGTGVCGENHMKTRVRLIASDIGWEPMVEPEDTHGDEDGGNSVPVEPTPKTPTPAGMVATPVAAPPQFSA